MYDKLCWQEGCGSIVEKPERNNQCYACMNLLKVFKINRPARDNLLKAQGGVCSICKYEIQFKGAGGKGHAVIDHCHTSGKIRSILCSRCNIGLGHFEDNTERLNKAIKYLEEFSK